MVPRGQPWFEGCIQWLSVLSKPVSPLSGYYWENAGCIYFGGKIYYVGNDLTYNSGRNEFNTLSLDGDPAFMEFTNIKTWLCMSGHMSWGARMELKNYTAHDIVRGATMFGKVCCFGEMY